MMARRWTFSYRAHLRGGVLALLLALVALSAGATTTTTGTAPLLPSPAASPIPSPAAPALGGGPSASSPSNPVSAASLLSAPGGVASGINSGLSVPAAGGSALPSTSADVRSPGMELPVDQSTGSAAGAANPYVPVVQKTPQQTLEDVRSQAFGAALTGLLPMHPDEIRKTIEHFDETRQAVETPIYPEPQPEVTAQTISLDPGATPPEIKVATGHVTTLTMLDASGEPWPIQDLTWAGNFEIGQPEEGSNVIRITPLAEFAQGNMSIRLLKLKTPVTFTLHTHRDKVQYRFDARIGEDGPYSKPPLIEGAGGPALEAGDSAQNSVLDGIPPAGATRMNISGADSRTSAYKLNGQIFLRTPLTLLSPGWSSSVSSADGMNVFTLSDTPVVLMSDKGTLLQAHLTDRDATPAGGGDLLAASEKDAKDASHEQ